MEQAPDLKSVGAITSSLGVRVPSPAPYKKGVFMDFGIFVIAIIIVAIAGYLLGYRACDENWRKETSERVNKMVEEKIKDVGALYEETYRNVLRHMLLLLKDEDNNQSH